MASNCTRLFQTGNSSGRGYCTRVLTTRSVALYSRSFTALPLKHHHVSRPTTTATTTTTTSQGVLSKPAFSFNHLRLFSCTPTHLNTFSSSSSNSNNNGYIDSTALVYSSYGPPTKSLKLLQHQIPFPPPEDQLCIEFLAFPINPADLNQIEGVYPSKPPLTKELYSKQSNLLLLRDPIESDPTTTGQEQQQQVDLQPSIAVAGNEGVGRVIGIGKNIESDGYEIGDLVVMGNSGQGTWRSRANLYPENITKIVSKKDQELIKGLDLVQACTLTVNPPTAYRLLLDFRKLNKGDYVIQNGANSGVGEATIQLAKYWGIKTINVIRDRLGSDDVKERLLRLGADYVILDSQLGKLETKKMVQEWIGDSEIKLGLNCVGGKMATEMARYLSKNGWLVTYGAMSKQPVILPASLQIFKNVTAAGFWLTAWNEEQNRTSHGVEERNRMMVELVEMVRHGVLKPVGAQMKVWKVKSGRVDEVEEIRQPLLDAVQDAVGGKGKQVVVIEYD